MVFTRKFKSINAFGKRKKFTTRGETAGIGHTRGQMLDRFHRTRYFPLFDHRGNVIGFAGRIMPGGREDTAKYINSPRRSTIRAAFFMGSI